MNPQNLAPNSLDIERLSAGDHHDPHSILGAHQLESGQWVVRGYHPDATDCVMLNAGQEVPLEPLGDGLFGVEQAELPKGHFELRYRFAGGDTWQRVEPFSFLPTVSETDSYLFSEGTHRRLYESLGARPLVLDGIAGTAFSVWAPNARRVSVVGDFCNWDGRLCPMRSLGSSGIWEIFIPGVLSGAYYKFEIRTQSGDLRIKTDPMASAMELPPGQASLVFESQFEWSDDEWLTKRSRIDHTRSPINIYELHLGSWARNVEEGGRSLSYREIAPRLAEHVEKLGFTHVEFMPLAEHAYYPSWGYQVTGYFAPTSRYGSPDDLKYLIDYLHQKNIGVIMDWVPAHFPKDDFSLRRFDGSALYEHEDARRGEHPDWGTLIFNYGRAEVRSFLVANAVYWLKEFHIDALRVDAVASMLYLDYSREPGQWVPNQFGGRENIEAIDFLRQMNQAVRDECPGAFTVAEESTAWGGVSAPVEQGGLGFTLKWNMGWMHDTLDFFEKEPIHRKYHIDQLTFAMIYEFTERFVNSISHDEVVHGKGSLIEKMPGDYWQKLANLRLFFAYEYTRPGKQLTFMGTEFGQHAEWNVDASLDWHLTDFPERQALMQYLGDLGRLYQQTEELWRGDPDHDSFEWIDCNDRENSVLSYLRRVPGQAGHVVVVLNLTPVPRENYRVGVPQKGAYRQLLNSDAQEYGGSDYAPQARLWTEDHPLHQHGQSIELSLPPLAALILTPDL